MYIAGPLCGANPVIGAFPLKTKQGYWCRDLIFLFYDNLNKLLNKLSNCRWFYAPRLSFDVAVMKKFELGAREHPTKNTQDFPCVCGSWIASHFIHIIQGYLTGTGGNRMISPGASELTLTIMCKLAIRMIGNWYHQLNKTKHNKNMHIFMEHSLYHKYPRYSDITWDIHTLHRRYPRCAFWHDLYHLNISKNLACTNGRV